MADVGGIASPAPAQTYGQAHVTLTWMLGQAGQRRAGSSAARWNHALERFMPFSAAPGQALETGQIGALGPPWERRRHALMPK